MKSCSWRVHPGLNSPKLLSRLEAFVVCNGEHAKESFAASEVVVTNRSIILLSGCVENVYLYFFAIQNNLQWTRTEILSLNGLSARNGCHLFPVTVGLCRLIILDELVVHELKCKLEMRWKILFPNRTWFFQYFVYSQHSYQHHQIQPLWLCEGLPPRTLAFSTFFLSLLTLNFHLPKKNSLNSSRAEKFNIFNVK